MIHVDNFVYLQFPSWKIYMIFCNVQFIYSPYLCICGGPFYPRVLCPVSIQQQDTVPSDSSDTYEFCQTSACHISNWGLGKYTCRCFGSQLPRHWFEQVFGKRNGIWHSIFLHNDNEMVCLVEHFENRFDRFEQDWNPCLSFQQQTLL